MLKVLKKGSRGKAVRDWQNFLRGQGLKLGGSDGIFGTRTEAATRAFQKRHRLEQDGVVGNRTYGRAMLLGFGVVADDGELARGGPSWPAPPKNISALTSTRERQRRFGKFDWEPAPTESNPEAIKILGDWRRNHIVRVEVPQLVTAGVKRTPTAWVHKDIADDFLRLWSAWEKKGLLHLVNSWDGSFVARKVRGGTSLSNHAFGTAFDINARWNRLGTIPALVGETGSLRELVGTANKHGFFWGGHYRRRLDGMHFEAGKREP